MTKRFTLICGQEFVGPDAHKTHRTCARTHDATETRLDYRRAFICAINQFSLALFVE